MQNQQQHILNKEIVTYTNQTVDFIRKLEKRCIQESNITPRLSCIQDFRKYISSNPSLSQQFQSGLDQIPQKTGPFDNLGRQRPGFLYKYKTDQMLDVINVAIQTPPRFWPAQVVGVHIYIIFIDLINTKSGVVVFARPDVNQYLKKICNQYGAMVRSQKSLKHMNSEQGGWLSEQAQKYVNYQEIKCDRTQPHYGFKCWNDWFIREFAQGVRPIDGINDPSIIVNSSQNYPLVDSPVTTQLKATDQFWLKQCRYSLTHMFQAQKAGVESIIKESFEGGTLYQGFLTPWCYHRWHSPVSGIVQKAYHISGTYFLQDPNLDIKQFNNFVNSQQYHSCVATRYVFIINTLNESIGRVAVIQIGMNQVSSCVPSVKQGDHVTKGQCIGQFQIGGSTHCIIFDRKTKLQFNPKIYQRQIKNGVVNSTKQNVNSWIARVIS